MKIIDFPKFFHSNPISPLLSSRNPILAYFVKRDLLGEEVGPIDIIHKLKPVQSLFNKQQNDGSWKSNSPTQKKYPAINYSLIETWKQFRFVIEKFGCRKSDLVVQNAADYIFSCQTEEGDIRGILANQYTTYYTGAILSLLIQAGYINDKRIDRGLQWLLSKRQNDGGWLASPLMSLNIKFADYAKYSSQDCLTVKDHDKSKPSSHNWTGMVLRAFAEHPTYKENVGAKNAGTLLKKAFFCEDKNYTSYKSADYWINFQFPYWWNNLVAAMDSLSKLGFSPDDLDINKALNWFIENQEASGLWKLSYTKKQPKKSSIKAKNEQLWVTFKICQIFKRFFS
jgi:hypothetical protein